MVEDLQWFPYFHIFGLGIVSVNEKRHIANPMVQELQ